LNSSTEELPSGKVKELKKKFENNSTPVPLSLKREIPNPQPSTPVAQPIKSTRQRQLEALAKKAELIKPPEQEAAQPVLPVVETKSQPKMVEKIIEEKFPEQDKEPSPTSSQSSSRYYLLV
jgi:hypothetical protein